MGDEGERTRLLRGGDNGRGGGKRRGRILLPTTYPDDGIADERHDFHRRDHIPFAASRRLGIMFIGATILIAVALINVIASKLSEQSALAAIASRQSGTVLGVQDLSHTVLGDSTEGNTAVGHGLGSVAGNGGTVYERGNDGRQWSSNSAKGGEERGVDDWRLGNKQGKSGRRSGRGGGEEKTKPNVFFFMIDDMGWNDIGYQSTDLSQLTPNLDRLAANGIKLNQYHSQPICTPARGALMTGRYPVRYGMQTFVIAPAAPWGLPLDEKILPEYMNEAGYESHIVGKWHLGSYSDDSLPHARGFDTFLGYLNGEESYWTHRSFEVEVDGNYFYDFGYGNETQYYSVMHNLTFLDHTNGTHESSSADYFDDDGAAASAEDDDEGGLMETERMRATDQERLLRQRQRQHQEGHEDGERQRGYEREDECGVLKAGCGGYRPFEDVDEGAMDYDREYSEDIFLGRANRIISNKDPWDEEPLFLYMAHQSVHQPIPSVQHGLFTEKEKKILEAVDDVSLVRRHFAVSLLYLDKTVGYLVSRLEDEGWMDNSIIIVASDNGGCSPNGGTAYPLRGGKQSVFEGGTRVPAFVFSKSHIPRELWGTTYDHMMHVTDWIPTLMSAVGGTVSGSKGPLDGVDQWASLTSLEGHKAKEGPRTEMLYNWDQYLLSSAVEMHRNDSLTQGAYRVGNWKLIKNAFCSHYFSYDPEVQNDALLDSHVLCGSMKPCMDCHGQCETDPDYKFQDWLFNLEEDPRESVNLIHDYPEKVDDILRKALDNVYQENSPSGVKDQDESVFELWIEREWWITPWMKTAYT